MEVEPFNPAEVFTQKDQTAGQLFTVVGKSERGKTHFVLWLLLENILRTEFPFQFGLGFVKTTFKNSYQKLGNLLNFHMIQGYDEEMLKKYVANLEAQFKKKGSLPRNFIIFDDLVGILNNQSQWFINYISTFRHYNTSIFICVQYLTGKNAISPIMREQTNYAIMFNSKTTRTIVNLYEAYGQLFPTKAEFQDYMFKNTDTRTVGPYVAIVYVERQDDIEMNYIPMRAPKDLPDIGEPPKVKEQKERPDDANQRLIQMGALLGPFIKN